MPWCLQSRAQTNWPWLFLCLCVFLFSSSPGCPTQVGPWRQCMDRACNWIKVFKSVSLTELRKSTKATSQPTSDISKRTHSPTIMGGGHMHAHGLEVTTLPLTLVQEIQVLATTSCWEKFLFAVGNMSISECGTVLLYSKDKGRNNQNQPRKHKSGASRPSGAEERHKEIEL